MENATSGVPEIRFEARGKLMYDWLTEACDVGKGKDGTVIIDEALKQVKPNEAKQLLEFVQDLAQRLETLSKSKE